MNKVLFWKSLKSRLRIGQVLDLDWRTGKDFEKLTITSTSGHNGTVGPRVLDYTGKFVPVPSGFPKGLRGVRVLSGIAGSPPVGWQVETNGAPYYSLGGGWGISWRDPDGNLLNDVAWWGPFPTIEERAQYSMDPSNYTLLSQCVREPVIDPSCPFPSPYLFGPSAGTNILAAAQSVLTVGIVNPYVWAVVAPHTHDICSIGTNSFPNGYAFFDLSAGVCTLSQSNTANPSIVPLHGGYWLIGTNVIGTVTNVTSYITYQSGVATWPAPTGTERVKIAYLGARTAAVFGYAIETSTAAVSVSGETLTIPHPGLTMSALADVDLSAGLPTGTAPRILSDQVADAGATPLTTAGATLRTWNGVTYVTAGASMTTATTKLGVARGGAGGRDITLRVDDALTMGSHPADFPTPDATLGIGGRAVSADLFNAPIRRIRLWNRALSNAELLAT